MSLECDVRWSVDASHSLWHMQGVQGFDLLSVLLAAEPIVVLNAAFCQLHRKRCPPSEQLLRECAYVSGPSFSECDMPRRTCHALPHGSSEVLKTCTATACECTAVLVVTTLTQQCDSHVTK